MAAHKFRYSDSGFRLIISVYSDFSSDILKEYLKKKPRALEFSIEGRILNLCKLSYLFKHRYFWTYDLQNVKGTYPFFYQGIQKK